MERVRRVSKLLGAVSAVVLACGVAGGLAGNKAIAASDEVTILGLWPFSGPYADVGPLLDRGAKVALDEAGNKAGGKKIKYITRDSETKAGTAARRVQEAVEGEGAKFVAGPWSSGVGLAVSEVALKNKVMHLFSGGTEDISGKRCNRYSFQWAANPWTAMEANLRMFKKNNPSAQSIYLLVADYAFGWSLQKYVEQLAPTFGLKVAGADRHPLGHREFSSYITKAVATNPDAIFMINFGTDSVTAVRQIYNFGFTPKKPVIMSWSSGTEELIQLDPEMRANLQVGTNYYWTIDNPKNKKFVEEYMKASNGVAPGYAPAAGYGMMTSILAGMDKANSTDPQKAIEALETFKGDTFVGPTTVNAKTHQIERPYFILKTKPKDQMKNENDLAEIIDVSSKPQPPELNECKDIGSF